MAGFAGVQRTGSEKLDEDIAMTLGTGPVEGGKLPNSKSGTRGDREVNCFERFGYVINGMGLMRR